MQNRKLEEFQQELERRRKEVVNAVEQSKQEPTPEEKIFSQMYTLLNSLRSLKSPDRTAKDRCVAVCVTEAEKLLAYYRTWILDAVEAVVHEGGQIDESERPK